MVVVKYTKERRNARKTVPAFSSSSAKELRTFSEGIAIKCHFYRRDEVMRVPATKWETDKVRFDIDEGRSVAYQTLALDRIAFADLRYTGAPELIFLRGEANQCISRAGKRITEYAVRACNTGGSDGVYRCRVRHLDVSSRHVNALTSANLRYMRVQRGDATEL